MTKHGMKVHSGKCKHRDVLPLESIVDYENSPKSRKYRVRWKDYSEDDDTWEKRCNIHPSEVLRH